MPLCHSCDAPIVWLKTVSGKAIPVDPIGVDPETDELFDPAKHTTHFSTCPQAAQHRRRRSTERAAGLPKRV